MMGASMFKDTKAFSGFSVNDLAAAHTFYGQTLGLDVSQDDMGLYLHISGGNDIFVYAKEDHAPATFTILNFPVDAIDDAVQMLKDTGIVLEHYENVTDEQGIARGLASGHGPDIAWFKDPAGNVLSVLQQQ
jgi:predicted enzyme related to lactoylglutathione lyase